MSSRKGLSALVIGSGFGGLSAACRLQATGFDVTIVEKRDQPGGRAYVFKDEGFTFDAGPTVITAPSCLREVFHYAGRRLEDYVTLLPVMPFYRLAWWDGETFDYSNDDAALLPQIERKGPGEVEGYKKFLKYSKAVFDEGYTRLVHVPFLTVGSMLKAAPKLALVGAQRSVYRVVAQYIRDPRLREAFSFHSLLVGGNPFKTSAIYTLIHFLERSEGVFFPKGGTGQLVQGFARLFNDLGGRLRLSSEVDEILTEGGKAKGVRLVSGETLTADVVVCNSEVIHTYDRLLRNEPKAVRRARSLKKSRHSMSLFLIYFGVKKKYPGLAHHTVIFGPRYRELLRDIFEDGVLAEDFSLYLHAPTVTDPSLAPDGCEGFYVLSPVPHLKKGSTDWSTEAPKYADRILSFLENKFLPGLKENLQTMRIFTPSDFETQLNSYAGSAFSLEPTLLQSAYFRVHNRDPKISGLYFVGAGTHPGAGVPGVVNSGKATASVILSDYGMERDREPETTPITRSPRRETERWNEPSAF